MLFCLKKKKNGTINQALQLCCFFSNEVCVIYRLLWCLDVQSQYITFVLSAQIKAEGLFFEIPVFCEPCADRILCAEFALCWQWLLPIRSTLG